MRNITIYILSVLFLVSAVSCNKEIALDATRNEAGITIVLHSAAPETKATINGVDVLNENLITSVHYFLYPKDGTDSNTETEPLEWDVFDELESQTHHTLQLNINKDEFETQLFKYPYDECDVYIIANLPNTIDIEALPDRKLSTLKNIALTTDFASSINQTSFVMEGLGTVEVKDRSAVLAADGDIYLQRVASKISVGITVADDIVSGDGLNWVPDPQGMTVEFVNGVKNAVLSGDPSAAGTLARFTDANVGRTFSDSDADNVWTCSPFYTYPSIWDVGDDVEPYLEIALPWETVGVTPVKTGTSIYKVILGGTTINRNTWYDLTINIGIVGNFDTQKEIIVEPNQTEYYVVDWTSGKGVNTGIQGGHYLVVDKGYYELFNQENLKIDFSSSHPCEIVGETCTYPNYKLNTSADHTDYTLDVTSNQIIFTNKLNNNMTSKEFDFTPYTLTFTLQHIDDDSYRREITIVQYPAIYVVVQDNSDTDPRGQGKVWVNGYNDDSANSGTDFFGGASGNTMGGDGNMFVFTVTTTEGTNYIIGDPRDVGVTYNSESARWFQGPSVNGVNRELSNYYGTTVVNSAYSEDDTGMVIYADDAAAEAVEPTINMIAPKFRLASGYGTVTDTEGANSLEIMKKRCAAYQEDGYPAGRWRLPTRAEFQFIYTQISYGNLPAVYLQRDNMAYWCAHGLGTPNASGLVEMDYIGYYNGGGLTTPVRCVYDEWYWENSDTYRLGTGTDSNFTPSDTFTWGDMPRENFQ